jgi:hypothetical protein
MTDAATSYHAAMTPIDFQVSDQRHEELRRMYEKAFGEEIPIEDARQMTDRLLVLYALLIRLFSDETSPPNGRS